MNGFRINDDGSLAPVSGSPFVTRTAMRFAVSVHGALIVASKDTIFAFAVDSETGTIQQTSAFQAGAISQLMTDLPGGMVLATTQAGPIAFLVSNGKLMAVPGQMTASEAAMAKAHLQPSAVLDASGKFMYVADASKAELAAFQVENGKPLALSLPGYPVPRGTAAITLVKPEQ
jgi:6-phosphogluconolactonase (cycloisomerase 2 family)